MSASGRVSRWGATRRAEHRRPICRRPAGQGEILSNTMSQDSENVGIVKATIDSLNRRDLDRAVEAAHQDFEADWSNSIAPHRGVYRGRDRARQLSRPSSKRGMSSGGTRKSSSRLTRRECWSSAGSGVAVGAAASKWTRAGAQLWTITGGRDPERQALPVESRRFRSHGACASMTTLEAVGLARSCASHVQCVIHRSMSGESHSRPSRAGGPRPPTPAGTQRPVKRAR